MAAHLRLAATQEAAQPSRRSAPALTVIDGTPARSPLYGPWRYRGDGYLYPRTGRFDRLELSRDQATKEWRELGDVLTNATDALHAAPDSTEALSAWRAAAFKALCTRGSGSLQNELRRLRTKLGLAAVLCGARFEYGAAAKGSEYDGGGEATAQEIIFATLDHAIFVLSQNAKGQR